MRNLDILGTAPEIMMFKNSDLKCVTEHFWLSPEFQFSISGTVQERCMNILKTVHRSVCENKVRNIKGTTQLQIFKNSLRTKVYML
jgi:hypothetical protein